MICARVKIIKTNNYVLGVIRKALQEQEDFIEKKPNALRIQRLLSKREKQKTLAVRSILEITLKKKQKYKKSKFNHKFMN